MESHWTYRLSDKDGQLLYVGYTTRLQKRLEAHEFDKPWWPEVARIEQTRHASREEGLDAEREMILRDNPLHNIARYPTVGGKTPIRAFRISDEIYAPALQRSKRDGIALTDIVKKALLQYGTTGRGR